VAKRAQCAQQNMPTPRGPADVLLELGMRRDAVARPPSGQGEGDGVQGQAHGRPDYRAVDADVLQVAPKEQF
jgi:hypothetical protein